MNGKLLTKEGLTLFGNKLVDGILGLANKNKWLDVTTENNICNMDLASQFIVMLSKEQCEILKTSNCAGVKLQTKDKVEFFFPLAGTLKNMAGTTCFSDATAIDPNTTFFEYRASAAWVETGATGMMMVDIRRLHGRGFFDITLKENIDDLMGSSNMAYLSQTVSGLSELLNSGSCEGLRLTSDAVWLIRKIGKTVYNTWAGMGFDVNRFWMFNVEVENDTMHINVVKTI